MIGSTPCENATRQSDVAISCSAPPSLQVGPTLVVVTVSGQTGSISVPIACPLNFYTGSNGRCRACPTGAACAGQDAKPVPIAGYWALSEGVFVPCIPAEACIASTTGVSGPNCAGAYTGDQCRQCSNQHYRSGTVCVSCPNNAAVLLALFVVMVVVIGVVASWLHRSMVNLKGLTIGIDMLQTLSMFGSFNFHWPVSVTYIFSIASASTFSPELTAPECTVSFSYSEKWVFMQVFPVVMAVVLVLGVVVSNAIAALRSRRSASAACSNTAEVIVGGIFTLLYYTYFTVVRRSLDIFACTRNAGGVYTLNADPSVRCWSAGSVQALLLPFAILSLAVYGIGVPLSIGLVLWKYGQGIKRDQALWLAGAGDTPMDNPEFSIRRRFAKLYQDYKPQHYGWRLVLLARKFCLVVITVLTSGNAMFQAALAVAVMAVSYGLHARHQPFVTVLEQAHALHETDKAAPKKKKLVQWSATPKQVAAGTRRSSVVILADVATAAALVARHRVDALVDFNVLETVLLCSSTAVLLGGMIYESSQLEPGSPQYWVLTVIVGATIVGSVLLFVWMLAVETRRTCHRTRRVGRIPSRGQIYRDGRPVASSGNSSPRHGEPVMAAAAAEVALDGWTTNPMRIMAKK